MNYTTIIDYLPRIYHDAINDNRLTKTEGDLMISVEFLMDSLNRIGIARIIIVYLYCE